MIISTIFYQLKLNGKKKRINIIIIKNIFLNENIRYSIYAY